MTYVGAYVVRGTSQTAATLLLKLEKEKVIARASPDLVMRDYRSFGIDDAEEFRSRARTKPLASQHRVFILSFASITVEAQNALLKTLEEPLPSALFFLVVPSPETLLPTIRSRVQTLEIERTEPEALIDREAFLKAAPEKRIAMLKPLLEYEEERDIGGIIAFLGSLESSFSTRMTPESREALRAIYRARKYATDRGSLLKALLEQVALLVPSI